MIKIIAEAGVNHNGNFETAKKLARIAKECGADAVKFQSFRAASLVSREAPKAAYQQRTTDVEESQYDMLKRLELGDEEHLELMKEAREIGIEFISTPFDTGGIDRLKRMGVSELKISSGDVTNGPMLVAAGKSGLPVLLSTGMSSLGEIEMAVGALSYGYLDSDLPPGEKTFRRMATQNDVMNQVREKITILHCTTEYPAPFEEVNLRVIDTLRRAFGLSIGYSDHTEGIAIPVAAVAMGATVIEKHFTLDKGQAGPDHRASIDPEELSAMVKGVRETETALGDGVKALTTSEAKNVEIVRKSLVAKQTIGEGEVFSRENLTSKRPGHGITPMAYWSLLGQTAKRAFEADEVIE